jgi:hypothetical protein
MKKLTFLIAILLLTANIFAQGHFVVAFTGNGQDHMNIFLLTATIEGVALEAGDEIAAFDGTICCGKVILSQPIDINNNKTFIDIKASRKDDGLSNGYTNGNAITYKFWDLSKNFEISGITAEYFDSQTGLPTQAPTYSYSGSAFVKLFVTSSANYGLGSNIGLDNKTQIAEPYLTLYSPTGLSEIVITIRPNEKNVNSELEMEEKIPTGTNPIFSDQKMILYPNPTSGKVKVVFNRIFDGVTYMTVNDLTGKTILKQNIQDKEEWINLNGNPPGLYLIRTNLNNMIVHKVILN